MTFAANALKAFAAAAYLLNGKVVEAEHWNTATAATALGEWSRARSLWAACGVRVPKGTGPIKDDYGLAVVRLHPWRAGETEYARSIDPVRARILNVPLPESGHRFGDIVPHDGAPTGFRVDDDGSKVAVLNELERLTPSAFQTDVVFVSCVRRDDLQALLDLTAPGLGYAKDSTESVRYYCLRCSFGTPHRHDAPKAGDWQPDRNLGIAAQSRKSVEKLLKVGVAKGSKRSIDGIASRECKLPERGKLSGHSARATLKHSGPEKRSSRFRVFPAGSEAARHSPVHRLGQSSRRAFGLWLGRLWLGKALVLLWGLPNGICRGVTR